MRCATVITGEIREGRHVHRCINCGREILSVSSEKCAKATCRMPRLGEPVLHEIELDHGPGTELADIFAEIGAVATASCRCKQNEATMNRWGIEGCRSNRASIIEWMKEGYRSV